MHTYDRSRARRSLRCPWPLPSSPAFPHERRPPSATESGAKAKELAALLQAKKLEAFAAATQCSQGATWP